jgi:outer membrane lipoprotein-sorting protein
MMSLFPSGAAAGVALLLGATVAAAPATRSLTFNMSTVTDAQGMHVNVSAKVWVKGDKARLETNQPMTGPMIVLVDGAKVHQLFPQQKRGTVTTIETGRGGPKNPMEFIIANVGQLTRGAKKTGQQTIDGYPCDVYLQTKTGEGRSVTMKAWVTRTTEPRLPLKVEISGHVKRPNMVVKQSQTTRITGIRRGVAIPDSLFRVPAGYKIVAARQHGVHGVPGPAGLGGPGGRP